jgi:hypothetical protein
MHTAPSPKRTPVAHARCAPQACSYLFYAQFVFAVLVPASKVGSFDGEVTALFEGVRAKVNTVLGQQFNFKSLLEEKLIVRGKKVIAAGPTISICASDCVLTEALEGDAGIAKLNMAYERADKLLEKQKLKWKEEGGEGGVLLLSAQVAGDLAQVPKLVALLQSGSDDAKAEAAAALWGLAVNADNKVAIAKEEGALAALVALLREGSVVGKENAAAALWSLAANANNKVAIAREEGALAALVALLREGSAVGKEHAAGALVNLAVNADNRVAIANEEGALAGLWWRCWAKGARLARRTRRPRCGAWRPTPTTRWPSPRRRARWRRWWRCCARGARWARSTRRAR